MQDPTPTLDLVRQAQSGDRTAISRLLERHREALLQRIRVMLGPGARRVAESGDFLQDVLVEALERFEAHRQRDERSFLRWLATIARNNIRDTARKRRERALESLSTHCLGVAASAAGPAELAERDEQLHHLVDVLVELADEPRRVVELRALEGRPWRAIAQAMGRSEDACRMLFRRALVRIGEELRGGERA